LVSAENGLGGRRELCDYTFKRYQGVAKAQECPGRPTINTRVIDAVIGMEYKL
jgi:hypothetical protein